MPLNGLLEDALRTTEFRVNSLSLGADSLRAAWRNQRVLPRWRIEMHGGITPVGDGLAAVRTELTKHLGPFAHPSTGDIGFKLRSFMGGRNPLTIESFSERVLITAAILGPQSVADLVMGWIQGKRINCEEVLLLSGLSLGQQLNMAHPGVRFESIQGEEADFIAGTAHGIVQAMHILPIDLMGPALVFDRWMDPPIFSSAPAEEKSKDHLGPFMGNREISELLDSLSLACNTHVEVKRSWMRHEEHFRLLNPGGRSYMSYFGRERAAQTVDLTSERLRFAESILSGRAGRNDLDLAIDRWKKSVSSSNPHDQLIELRVVLEALYAGGASSEVRFRVALHGAWHLRRKNYFVLFKKIYDDASRVIHAARPKPNRELIENARDACRDAIIKRLTEDEGTDFTKEILDAMLLESTPQESGEQ